MKDDSEFLNIFPSNIFNVLKDKCKLEQLYEIRIKINKPIIVYSNKGESIVNYNVFISY